MKLLLGLLYKIHDLKIFQWILFSILALAAFYKIFSFWFYHGWETSWFGLMGGNFSLVNIMKSHGLISYMNYMLFGWRPLGWFVTALLFHIVTAMVVNLFIARKINKTVGLVAGLLFLVTTAHHDVVTWGTFESLYAAQTLCFYIGLWLFDKWKQTQKIYWYGAMLLVFLVSLIIRESGLLFVPLVFLFDIICYENILRAPLAQWPSSILSIVRRHIPLWVVSLGYLSIRNTYGGSSHDFIDERVQFRILLFHEHRYLEYIRYGLLSFGYFIGPYVIPYPVLNILRDIILHIFPLEVIRIYFFAVFGWVTYMLFSFTVYKQRKERYAAYLIFSLLAFTCITLFYSFAWTVKDSFLAAAYSWSENRWRYLGFTFFASAVSIVLYNFSVVKFKKFHLKPAKIAYVSFALVAFYLIVNTILLHGIEDQMYRANSAPQKLFYQTFLSTFPSLTARNRFYAFKGSPGLGDFFSELYVTASTYYPMLGKVPNDWLRSEMYYILLAMKNRSLWAENIHFIDFSAIDGIRDHTKEVKSIFSQLQPIDLKATGAANKWKIDIAKTFPVDFRYSISFDYQAVSDSALKISQRGAAIDLFSTYLASLISDVEITACKTMGSAKETLYDVRKELALDGNLGAHSFWWADCRPAWIVLDMGKESIFSGAVWASTTSVDSFPRDYHYDVSRDGKTWEKTYVVKGNMENSKVDIFPTSVSGRYIRLWVDETSFRQMLRIDEFVPLFPETAKIASYYTQGAKLYADMEGQAGYVSWIQVQWFTSSDSSNLSQSAIVYEPIITDGQWHSTSFELPDSEYYSNQGEYLRRRLSHISLVTPEGVSVKVGRIELSSPFGD